MNNFNIMGVHQFLGDGGHNNIKGELPRKGSLDAHYDLILVHART